MEKLMDLVTNVVKEVFVNKGYDEKYALVTLSNRPDLCQFQCNGAMAAAKAYKKAPIAIATEIVDALKDSEYFKTIEAIMPGFININLSDAFIVKYLNQMSSDKDLGCSKIGLGKKVMVDYGGPNVAKPLHVGHLRTAIIGESIKRVGRFLGYEVLGDVHLGDWGLQIGMIIVETKKRMPELSYFDDNFEGEYPETAPFTISELEDIYPTASGFAKENADFMEQCKQATVLFQNGHKGYVALWKHIINVSITDLKKNYSNLNVEFDLWKKESDAQPYIPAMIEKMKKDGFAHVSQGALVVDVIKETDKKEMPPCILVKSDGATLYATTDLATIVERMQLFNPDEIIYIVDKRQEMHFEQVFRTAIKTGIVAEHNKLTFLGFGTMNGKDGKPFKTRDGGVMRLETLISQVSDKVYERVMENKSISEAEAKEVSKKVGLAALKYGDLSNQVSKDYIFDIDRFTSFEGNTGPYILYTVVRIKSILSKYLENHNQSLLDQCAIGLPNSESELNLMLKLTQFNDVMISSFLDYSPNKICQFIYDLSNEFNRFYHENKIITEEDANKQFSWISVIVLTKNILEKCLELLAIEAPDRM